MDHVFAPAKSRKKFLNDLFRAKTNPEVVAGGEVLPRTCPRADELVECMEQEQCFDCFQKEAPGLLVQLRRQAHQGAAVGQHKVVELLWGLIVGT